MLSRTEGLPDHLWLVQDGQGDDHGGYVAAIEEVIEGFSSGGGAIEIDVYAISGCCSEGLGGLLRARVDCFEGGGSSGCGSFDCGEVF